MKVIAITQARMGSTRLPNKVLMKIGEQTLLNIHIKRILSSSRIDQLIVATTTEASDDPIAASVDNKKVALSRGSVNNVLDRFYQAALPHKPDWVVRLTGDCPLLDSKLMDAIIDTAISEDVDYCSNTLQPTYPDGMDVEVMKFSALEKAWNDAVLDSEKEHVTPYIYKNSDFHQEGNPLFSAFNYKGEVDYGAVRLTVDEPADFEVIRQLVEKLGTHENWKAYADYYLAHKTIMETNISITRNEGYRKSLQND